MINEKKFDWELVEWTVICWDLYQHMWMGGPVANSDRGKQSSAVRASGGFPGNGVNVTRLHLLSVNMGSGNCLVPSGNKPLPEPSGNKPLHEPMLTHFYFAIYGVTRPQWAWMRDVMYTLGQKFSDFFLDVSNLQINLFGLLQKIGIL